MVPGVKVGTDDLDLGTVRLATGRSLRLHILVKDGEAPPSVSAFATRDGEPGYMRGTTSRGAANVVVPGLGAGKFSVYVHYAMGTGRPLLREVVEVDGIRDVERTIDLR